MPFERATPVVIAAAAAALPSLHRLAAVLRRCAAGLFFGLLLVVPSLPAQAQTPPEASGEKTDVNRDAQPDAGFRLGPTPRMPTMNRPLGVQRPMMMQRPSTPHPSPRMSTRGSERHIGAARRPRAEAARQPAKHGAAHASRHSARKGSVAKRPSERQLSKKTARPEKPSGKPAGVEQPAKKPDTPAVPSDRGGSFSGKPDHVAHNPLHNDGPLGKSTDHKPLTIEKYGKYYTRSYYSTIIDDRPAWYWFDTPVTDLPANLPPSVIPVCNGDTDNCPAPNPPVLADDQPKLKDQEEKPKEGEKKEDGKDEKKKPTLAETVEKLCPDGKIVAGHAFSQCVGGFWHVVSYDTFYCPSDDSYKRLKTFDLATTQPCSESYDPGGDLTHPKGDCGKIVDDPNLPPVVLIRCLDNRIVKDKYHRAHCEPGGQFALGLFIEHVPVNPPEACESGEKFKPKLDEKYKDRPIGEPDPDKEGADKGKP